MSWPLDPLPVDPSSGRSDHFLLGLGAVTLMLILAFLAGMCRI